MVSGQTENDGKHRYRISGFVSGEDDLLHSEGDLLDFEFFAENNERAIKIADDEYDHVSNKQIWKWIDEQTLAASDQPVDGERYRYCVRGTIPQYGKDKLRDFFFPAESDEEAMMTVRRKYSSVKNKELWKEIGYVK